MSSPLLVVALLVAVASAAAAAEAVPVQLREGSLPPLCTVQTDPAVREHFTVVQGEPVTLPCPLSAQQAVTAWAHYGGPTRAHHMVAMAYNGDAFKLDTHYRLQQVHSVPAPGLQWKLLVTHARLQDAGIYRCNVMPEQTGSDECQHPQLDGRTAAPRDSINSWYVQLQVLAPERVQLDISGVQLETDGVQLETGGVHGEEVVVPSGSHVHLHCVLPSAETVVWTRDGLPINAPHETPHQPGLEPATVALQVRHANNYTTAPTENYTSTAAHIRVRRLGVCAEITINSVGKEDEARYGCTTTNYSIEGASVLLRLTAPARGTGSHIYHTPQQDLTAITALLITALNRLTYT